MFILMPGLLSVSWMYINILPDTVLVTPVEVKSCKHL